MKTLFFICFALCCSSLLKAQNELEEATLSGVVVDGQSLTPLPYANITKNHRQGIATDAQGNFTIKINPQDTIEITYVGYQNQVLSREEKEENYVIVSLKPSISMLQEVEIRFTPTEAEFKETFFSLQPTRNEINARNNISLIKLQADAIATPEDDPFINHPYIDGSSSFTFFSSGGQEGITSFIRSARIIHSQSTYFHLKPYQLSDKILLTAVNLTEHPDSVSRETRDSLVTKKSMKQQ